VRAIGELPAAEGALAVIETRNQAQDPGFLTPMEITFQFAQPIGAEADLRRIVDAVQAVPGVAAVKSDGVNMIVQYDSARLEPAQIRQLLDQLGFAFAPGTDVPDAGDSRD
jgi:copper chaperone CopZ